MMRVGVLGCGGMGAVHANQYKKMPDVELYAFDADPDRLKSYLERFPANPAAHFEDLVSRCDLIDVCLPTDLHLPFALKAIASGRAVFVEKPMASTIEECAAMLNAAEKAGTPLMPGQVVRFFPEFAKGNQLVRDGAVGTPAAARTRRGGGAPKGHGGWFMDFSRSGGVLLDLAIHDFDWLRWTFGEIKHLYSRSVAASMPGKIEADYALTTMTFDSGLIAHTEATWMDPSGFRTTFEVCGSEGMIQHDSRLTPTVQTYTAAGSSREAPMAPNDDPYYREIRGFIDSIQSKDQLPVTPMDGLMAVSIARAAMESATTGKVVSPARHF